MITHSERSKANFGWAATGAIVAPSAILASRMAEVGNQGMAVLIMTLGGALGVGTGAALAARLRQRYWRGPGRASAASMVAMWIAVFLLAWALFLGWPETTELAAPGEVNAVTNPRGGTRLAFWDRVRIEPSVIRVLYCLAGFGFVGGTLTAWRLSPTKTAVAVLRVIAVGIAAACALVFASWLAAAGFSYGYTVVARVVRATATTMVLSAALAGALGAAISGAIAEAALFWSVVGRSRA